MKIEDWLPLYREICEQLGIDMSRDLEAAHLLSEAIEGRHLTKEHLAQVVKKHRWAVVFGAGPSLEHDLDEFLNVVGIGLLTTVAADGACRAFLERDVKPDVVVTDLDGGDEVLLEAAERGSLLVVHAHGDNIDKIKQLIPKIRVKVVGTTQTRPVGVLENFGGFTDGDRAAYMCEDLGVENIVVAGMDFDGEVGKYSKPFKLAGAELVRKKNKLQIGKRLLINLAKTSNSVFYDVSKSSKPLDLYKKIQWADVLSYITR